MIEKGKIQCEFTISTHELSLPAGENEKRFS